MPIDLHQEAGAVFRLDFRGTLRKAEMQDCQRRLAAEVDRIGAVRLLCVLTDFNGWERRPDWDDTNFFVEHGAAIERIAIIGPPRWRTQALLFAGADLRRAPVAFFPLGTMGEARLWLTDGIVETGSASARGRKQNR